MSKQVFDNKEPREEKTLIPEQSHNEQVKEVASGRRDFLRKAVATGALAHFVLVGGTHSAHALPAACAPANSDDCAITATGDSDTCSMTNYDTCFGKGSPTTDVCNPLISTDKCTGGGTAYDSCTTSSPDVTCDDASVS